MTEEDCSSEIEQPFQHTTYQMTHLQPDTVYKVELRAHNAIGHSSPAEIRIKTARGKDSNYFSYAYSGAIKVTSNSSFTLLFVLLSIIRH